MIAHKDKMRFRECNKNLNTLEFKKLNFSSFFSQ